MPGLTTNIINLISDNLRDRYRSGFPILKELIQNADDAGARRAVFGIHEGLAALEHPLLTGPALYLFNDGTFRETDKRAITSFAENSKAGEPGTIGKFGLGMKSAFHLCEAFLYLAWDRSDIHQAIVNPWNSGEDNLHPNWEDVQTADWSALRSVGARISGNAPRGFLLWVPLRRKQHLRTPDGAQTGSIIDRFPGDDLSGPDLRFLAEDALPSRLAVILPLLLHLEELNYRPLESAGKDLLISIAAERRLERGAGEVSSTGVVTERATPVLKFHGQKREHGGVGSVFNRLREHSAWPKSYFRDAQGFQQLARDKSEAEGSVLIGHEDGVGGGVTLRWAVFLPLNEEAHVFRAAIPASSRHYHIVLHGQFFVDAGRRGIHEFSRLFEPDHTPEQQLDESGLRRRWNRELADGVTLPLLLPVLDEYVKTHCLRDKEISELTKGIGDAAEVNGGSSRSFLEYFGSKICREMAWVRRIDRNGSRWTLEKGRAGSLRALPAPPAVDRERPWRCLPGLNSLGRDRIFIDGAAPRITDESIAWQESDLLAVLAGDAEGALSSAELLDYLGQFLAMVATPYRNTTSLQDALIRLLRSGLRANELPILRQRAAPFSRVLGFVLPDRRRALGTVNPIAPTAIPPEVFAAIWACETTVLIVPADLDAAEPACARPKEADLVEWLRAIDRAVAKLPKHDPALSQWLATASSLLDTAVNPELRGRILRTNRDLRVLSARDARNHAEVAVSTADLQAAMSAGNLLGFGQGTTLRDRLGKAPQLANALPEETVIVVASGTVPVFLDDSTRPGLASEEMTVLRALGVRPKVLGEKPSRLALIQVARDARRDEVARRGLRYLLHGSKKNFEDADTTLWVGRHQQSPAWEKLWRQVSGITGANAWNVLTRDLVEHIPQASWDALGMSEIDPAQVVLEINRVGVKNIDAPAFTDAERTEILGFVVDGTLWRSLPLHTLIDGKTSPIDEKTFLDTGLEFPAELGSDIKIVRPDLNDVVAGKQKNWIPPLDISALAGIALNSPAPSRYWPLIFRTLDSNAHMRLSSVARVESVKWLPLRSGDAVAPSDVIDIPELAVHIQLLASEAGYCYAGVQDLSSEVLQHPNFETLRNRHFSSGEEGLAKLSLLMSAANKYFVGHITALDSKDLSLILPSLKRVRQLPAWQVIADARLHFSADQVLTRLLNELRQPIPIETLEAVIHALAEQAANGEGASAAFNIYLGVLASHSKEGREILPRVRLPSVSGEWRLATELCYGAAGIDERFLLTEESARLLAGVIVKAGGDEPGLQPRFSMEKVAKVAEAAPTALANYFKSWEPLIRPELIGALLCLFGPRVRELAQRELGARSVDGIRGQLGWRMPDQIDHQGRREWMYRFTAEQALETLLIGVEIVAGDSVSVTGITGQGIDATLARDFDTTIVGEPWWGETQPGQRQPVLLPLRQINPADFEPEKLSDLLRQTAEYILRACYGQSHANLDSLWKEIDRTDQLEIEVARAMLLEHLPFYLRQLGAHHHHQGLRNNLDRYDRAWQRLKEAECSNSPDSVQIIEELRSEVRNRLDDVRRTLTEDETAQTATLQAVREKLRNYQYDTTSIAFELFQNADDAVVELIQRNGLNAEDARTVSPVRKFSVIADAGIVRFAHWGRLINARTGGKIAEEDHGFQRDLQKMLVLWSSDKPVGHDLTGKFGLGFKSVLLACDRPKLLSGRMRTEIVGGVLPRPWNEAQVAAKWLADENKALVFRGTLIEIALHQQIDPMQMLDRFRKLSGVLCIFGRAIRHINIQMGRGPQTVEWSPEQFVPDVEVGKVELPDDGKLKWANLVVFRLPHGSILLKTSPNGFQPLPHEVPSLWVTAPTREEQRFGFAVSANFAVDAGRSRLAGEATQNFELATKLGRELGERLMEFGEKLRAEPDSVGKLGVASSVSIGQIWASLWRVLSSGGLGSDDVTASLGKEIALRALYPLTRSSTGVPNGLPPPFDAMVDRAQISREITGIWARSEILGLLERVPSLSRWLALKSCVTSDIAAVLRQLHPVPVIGRLDLASIIASIEDTKCDFADAQPLEPLCDRIWQELDNSSSKSAMDAMELLRFRAMNDAWAPSRRLLCAETGDDEEKRIVALAPESMLLHDSYGKLGRQFFRRSRPRFEVQLEELANWVRTADGCMPQLAALQYMRLGERALKLGIELRKQGLASTWLEGINEGHPCFAGWNSNEIDSVLRQLIPTVYFSPPVEIPPVLPEPSQLRGAEAVLRIHAWWLDEGRKKYQGKYLEQLYPNGQAPNLARDDQGRFDREAWMKLLSLGVLQSIGRVKDFQNRGFLELLQRRHWWGTIANVDPRTNPTEWLNILEEFGEGQIDDEEFGIWMDCFPRLFRLARWLDAYVELFTGIDHREAGQMALLLTPLGDATLQGGGPSAPALNRTLRMGFHLVVRELLRLGIIRSAIAFPYAFMPSRGVCQLVSNLALGGDANSSAGIYQSLTNVLGEEAATFEGDFDIPLRILAYDPSEARRLLGVEILTEDNNG